MSVHCTSKVHSVLLYKKFRFCYVNDCLECLCACAVQSWSLHSNVISQTDDQNQKAKRCLCASGLLSGTLEIAGAPESCTSVCMWMDDGVHFVKRRDSLHFNVSTCLVSRSTSRHRTAVGSLYLFVTFFQVISLSSLHA